MVYVGGRTCLNNSQTNIEVKELWGRSNFPNDSLSLMPNTKLLFLFPFCFREIWEEAIETCAWPSAIRSIDRSNYSWALARHSPSFAIIRQSPFTISIAKYRCLDIQYGYSMVTPNFSPR